MCIFISKCYSNLPMCMSHQKTIKEKSDIIDDWTEIIHKQTSISIQPNKILVSIRQKSFQLELPNLVSQQLIYFLPSFSFKLECVCINDDEIVWYMILIILINISCIPNGLTGNQDHSKPSEIIHPHCYYSMINVKSSSK